MAETEQAEQAKKQPEVFFCARCGRRQWTDEACVGDDSDCPYGPDMETPAPVCEGWGMRCCRCGAAWALDQI